MSYEIVRRLKQGLTERGVHDDLKSLNLWNLGFIDTRELVADICRHNGITDIKPLALSEEDLNDVEYIVRGWGYDHERK